MIDAPVGERQPKLWALPVVKNAERNFDFDPPAFSHFQREGAKLLLSKRHSLLRSAHESFRRCTEYKLEAQERKRVRACCAMSWNSHSLTLLSFELVASFRSVLIPLLCRRSLFHFCQLHQECKPCCDFLKAVETARCSAVSCLHVGF